MPGDRTFRPTAEQRETVRSMAGFGVPAEDIVRVIKNSQTGKPITAKTLRKWFRDELDTGTVVANAKVAQNLYKMATGTGKEAVTASIFWLKTRARWKETSATEITGHVTGGAVNIYLPDNGRKDEPHG